MTERTQRSDSGGQSDEPHDHRTTEAALRAGSDDANVSRRHFLRTSAATGALALGLGAASDSASAAKVEEICNSDYGKIQVGGNFTLMDNRWGMQNAQQCIWLNDDGSYGYDFDASSTSGGINYPEVFVGTRPWGDDTGVPEFPVQRRNVDELTMQVDADVNVSGGEWDWAEEWWLMEQPPSQQAETHVYEVMLLLDWGGGHDHGAVETRNAWTDRYGNTVDHWTTYNSGGTNATFYIFRIQGGYSGGRIDMTEIVDYMSANSGATGDLWLSGIELGNEYWGGATGTVTYNDFQVTVNGATYTSGGGGGSSGSGGGGGGGGGGDTETRTPTEDRSSSGGQSPYGGSPHAVPGTIEAEDYDRGGQDVAYSDTTGGNEGGASYRSGDVDVESATRGGYNVGWIASGEWWEYTVDVQSSGQYDVSALVASNSGGGDVRVEVDGSQVASTSFGATGGWQSWTTTSVGSTYLSAGEHVVRVVAESGNWNFNRIEFAESGSGGGGSTTETETETPTPTETETSSGGSSGGDSGSGGSGGGSSSGDPIATLDPSTTSASVGERVTFQVNDTSGSGRWIQRLEWEFGDGATATGWWNAHAYDSAGSYTVALHATDNSGTTTTYEVTITVS